MKRFWPVGGLLLLTLAVLARPRPLPLSPPATRSSPSIAPTPPDATSSGSPTLSPPDGSSPRPNRQAPAEPPEDSEAQAWRKHTLMRSLVWLARQQNPDGSWGDVPVTLGDRSIGKTGVSSFAFLSLLGGGYSYLSRDDYDGTKMGPVMRRGAQWLLQDQGPDGSFRSVRDEGFDQALGALALSEAYAQTVHQSYKEPAIQALQALVRMQNPDGSWGGSEETLWAVTALSCAEQADLAFDQDALGRALGFTKRSSHPANVLSRIRLARSTEQIQAEAEAVASQLPEGAPWDLAPLYDATFGVFMVDGPQGPLWKRWRGPLKSALLASQQADGSWLGGTRSHSIVRSSLAQMMLLEDYRFTKDDDPSR